MDSKNPKRAARKEAERSRRKELLLIQLALESSAGVRMASLEVERERNHLAAAKTRRLPVFDFKGM